MEYEYSNVLSNPFTGYNNTSDTIAHGVVSNTRLNDHLDALDPKNREAVLQILRSWVPRLAQNPESRDAMIREGLLDQSGNMLAVMPQDAGDRVMALQRVLGVNPDARLGANTNQAYRNSMAMLPYAQTVQMMKDELARSNENLAAQSRKNEVAQGIGDISRGATGLLDTGVGLFQGYLNNDRQEQANREAERAAQVQNNMTRQANESEITGQQNARMSRGSEVVGSNWQAAGQKYRDMVGRRFR